MKYRLLRTCIDLYECVDKASDIGQCMFCSVDYNFCKADKISIDLTRYHTDCQKLNRIKRLNVVSLVNSDIISVSQRRQMKQSQLK